MSHTALLGMCLLPCGLQQGGWTGCQSCRACGFLVLWPFFPGWEAAGVCAVEEQKHRGGGVWMQPGWVEMGKPTTLLPGVQGRAEGGKASKWQWRKRRVFTCFSVIQAGECLLICVRCKLMLILFGTLRCCWNTWGRQRNSSSARQAWGKDPSSLGAPNRCFWALGENNWALANAGDKCTW